MFQPMLLCLRAASIPCLQKVSFCEITCTYLDLPENLWAAQLAYKCSN